MTFGSVLNSGLHPTNLLLRSPDYLVDVEAETAARSFSSKLHDAPPEWFRSSISDGEDRGASSTYMWKLWDAQRSTE